jgi:predicted kinase
MPTAHLISGLPCSGKTTYAVALRADANSVLFSLDRWLITSFGRYSIAAVGHEEHTRRVLACRELIWDAAAEFLRRSVDVILDDGFFLRDNRVRYVGLSNAVGARAKIHFMDTAVSVLRARLEERNAKLPRYNFFIDPETLQGFLGLFEEPSEQEGAELVVVQNFAQRPMGPNASKHGGT